MKFIFILLFSSPLFSFAQQKDTVAIKGANRIIVVTNRPARDNYQLIILAFKDNGYILQEIDPDSLTVLTTPQRAESANTSYQMKGVARENEIIFSGTYSSRVESSISGASYKTFVNDISNAGKKGSASRYAFNVMDILAKQIPGKIFYTINRTRRISVF